MAWTIIKNGQRYTVAFPEVTNVGIRILLGFVVVTLMLTAYVRLREKEI